MVCKFLHKWNGCKCEKCEATRDKKHEWDGCKCKKCGKIRDEQHDWDGCKCVKCGYPRNEQHKWNGCKCEKCGKYRGEQHIWDDGKCKICGITWKPSNPRLSSNKPLSSLKRIFILTNGDGKTILNCPVAMGTLADTAGAPLSDILKKVSFDIISKSNVAEEILQIGKVPDSLFAAIQKIDADAAQQVMYGSPSVRPVKNPRTGESSVCVLLY